MATPEVETRSDTGFLERWLRRCGERPWRSFLLHWLWLFLLSLPLLLLHTKQSFSGEPPDPRGIEYAKYRSGEQYALDWGMSVEVEDFPPFDSSAKRLEVGVHPRLDSRTGKARLQAYVPKLILCGGPYGGWVYSHIRLYDVTDPRDTSQPFEGVSPPGLGFGWHPSSIGMSWTDKSGSRIRGIGLQLPGALLQLAAPQVLAAVVVLPFAVAFRWRRRRRARANRCEACGHLRDPCKAAEGSRCPECGLIHAAMERTSARKSGAFGWLARPGNLAGTLFIILLIVWLNTQACVSGETLYPLDDEKQRLRSAHASELGRTYTTQYMMRTAGYGWPVMIYGEQDSRWFTYAAGAAPAPASSGWPQVSLSSSQLNLSRYLEEPNFTRLYWFHWPMIIFQLAMLHAAAVVLGAVVPLLAKRWKERTSRELTPAKSL